MSFTNPPYTFNDYDSEVGDLAVYPHIGSNLIYPALGLIGEAGEVAEKVKKLWRDKNFAPGESQPLDKETQLLLLKEIGDVVWYCNALAKELGSTLEHAAQINSYKLRDRAARNVVHGEGDNR
jgi:NTP pyrophosphatase (non-canonical NTP hydrolase)